MNFVPHATPTMPPELGWSGKGEAGDESIRWNELVSRLLHPVQLSMVEALLWIELPISPADLSRMYGGVYSSRHTAYHVQVLMDHGVLEMVDTEPVRGATRHLYVLSPGLRWR
jgi:hypothetical protein